MVLYLVCPCILTLTIQIQSNLLLLLLFEYVLQNVINNVQAFQLVQHSQHSILTKTQLASNTQVQWLLQRILTWQPFTRLPRQRFRIKWCQLLALSSLAHLLCSASCRFSAPPALVSLIFWVTFFHGVPMTSFAISLVGVLPKTDGRICTSEIRKLLQKAFGGSPMCLCYMRDHQQNENKQWTLAQREFVYPTLIYTTTPRFVHFIRGSKAQTGLWNPFHSKIMCTLSVSRTAIHRAGSFKIENALAAGTGRAPWRTLALPHRPERLLVVPHDGALTLGDVLATGC